MWWMVVPALLFSSGTHSITRPPPDSATLVEMCAWRFRSSQWIPTPSHTSPLPFQRVAGTVMVRACVCARARERAVDEACPHGCRQMILTVSVLSPLQMWSPSAFWTHCWVVAHPSQPVDRARACTLVCTGYRSVCCAVPCCAAPLTCALNVSNRRC